MFLRVILGMIFGVVISFQKAFGRELIFRDSLVEIFPQRIFGRTFLFRVFLGRFFLEEIFVW